MRRLFLFLGLAAVSAAGVLAAAPLASWTDDLSPIAAADWNVDRAAHLLERAGFGGTPEDIARLAVMTPQQAVDSLVEYARVDDSAPPFVESGIWDRGMDPFPASRADAVRQGRERGEALGVKALPDGT